MSNSIGSAYGCATKSYLNQAGDLVKSLVSNESLGPIARRFNEAATYLLSKVNQRASDHFNNALHWSSRTTNVVVLTGTLYLGYKLVKAIGSSHVTKEATDWVTSTKVAKKFSDFIDSAKNYLPNNPFANKGKTADDASDTEEAQTR